MAFVSGLMGPYMSPIPINSSLGMAISLIFGILVSNPVLRAVPAPHGVAGSFFLISLALLALTPARCLYRMGGWHLPPL